MTFLVPFDGSPLSAAALRRATQFAGVLDGEVDVVVVSVVRQGNAAEARARGWLDDDEPFSLDAVVETLRDRVAEIAPDASFRHELVDRYAPPGAVSRRVRRLARQLDVPIVFVGSDNAGRLVQSITSVGGGIAADAGYDVVIVRGNGATDGALGRPARDAEPGDPA